MKIIIIGAGISGCASYLLLKNHLPKPPGQDSNDYHSITLYEAYDVDRNTDSSQRRNGATHSSTLAVGGGLGIARNGLGVLKRLDEDLLREIVSAGYVTPIIVMKNKNGKVLVRASDDDLASDPNRSTRQEKRSMKTVGCTRHALWQSLRVRIPDSDVITRRVSRVTAKTHSRNIVSFVDGTPDVEADLVIGADGLKSTTRSAVFPEAESDPYPAVYE